MSFPMRIEQRVPDRRRRPSGDAMGPLTAIGIVFAAFCVYDYSPYGHGYVAILLADAQRWFQGFVGSFKLKM